MPMETIFNHNVTDEELKRFGGREYLEWVKAIQGDYFNSDDDANYFLGILFSMRGDKEKAHFYWDKMVEKSRLQVFDQDYRQ